MTETDPDLPRFQPPFGGAGCYVINPKDHQGYRHVVAWAVGLGATSREFVIGECAKAAAEGAPTNAVYKTSVAPHDADNGTEGEWVVFDDISRPENKERIEQYVQAMVDFEERLAKWHEDRKNQPPLHSYTLTYPSTTTITVEAVSLQAAKRALDPIDGALHHEVKQVVPAIRGTMRVMLDRPAGTLIATDDPTVQAPPSERRMLPLRQTA
ncbi:hypothetical protein ACWEDZ_02790 [Streptomyces sp. NPDC005047]